MNVSVQPAPGVTDGLRKILVVEKDVEAGEVIYKEEPLVAVLDADLEGQGTHCSHCLRHIQRGMAIRPDTDRLNSVYCSKDCQVRSKVQSQNLLFGLDPVLPPELDGGMDELTKPARAKAQEAFTEYIKSKGKSAPLLAARFVARQVAIETGKMMPSKLGPVATEVSPSLVGEYGMYDHIERLRFLDAEMTDEETKILSDVFAAALPGLEQSIPSERHGTNLGKMSYNAIGVCFSGGRDDKPASTERPEDQERTRTPYGTSRQVGCGLYPVSAYMAHCCAPSARPSFSSGTSELQLVTTRPLKKGDELTMSYVDASQHPDETPVEARRRRRVELVRGWRFRCDCARCTEELAATPAFDVTENVVELEKDGSRVEDVVKRVELGGPQKTFLGTDTD